MGWVLLFLLLVGGMFPPGPPDVREQFRPSTIRTAPPGAEEEEGPDSNGGDAPSDERRTPPPDTVEEKQIPELLQGHDRYYRVEYVFDGDSFSLAGGHEVRLIGVDAPEREAPYADRARKKLRSLLPEGSVVAVDFDRQVRDRFDRLLGYVHTVRRKKKKLRAVFVNRHLVEEGLARVFLNEENLARRKTLIGAQRRAIRKSRGLFGELEETEETYYRIKKNFRFHRPGCRYIEDIPGKYRTPHDSKRDALMDGLSPGPACEP